jgi:hypothetical protein
MKKRTKLSWLILAIGLSIHPIVRAQTCAFDAQGQLSLVRYSSTQSVNYAYDRSGNITNVIVTGTLAEPDTNANGLPDAWEWVYFNNLTNTASGDNNKDGWSNLTHYQNGSDPLAPDTDGDNMINTDENRVGTDPLSSHSFLGVQNLMFNGGSTGWLVRWSCASNKFYRLKRSTNLIVGFDSIVRTNIPSAYPVNVETDQIPWGAGQRFYRIELE